jgi:Carboxypeptidase regulatory-like domain
MKRSLSLFLLSIFGLTAFGQVEGDVQDENKKAITNAVIIAKDSTGKIIDTVKTDERGFYHFKKLKPGNYTIEGKAPGFLITTHTTRVIPARSDANESDDTYHADVLDIILKRQKPGK